MNAHSGRLAMTGSTGFLGRHVAASLRAIGVEVVELVRMRRAESPADVHTVTAAMVETDLDDPPDDLLERLGYPHTLLHLAWEGLDDYSSPEHLEVQLPRHLRFVTRLFQLGLPRVVVAGTCFEYGLAEGPLTETMVAAPVTAYAAAKSLLREGVIDAAEQFGTDLTWMRLFYVYGPGQSEKTLWGQCQAAIENGSPRFAMSPGDQQRDYLHVQRMAGYIAEIAARPIPGRVTTNICSGQPIYLRDLVRGWIAESGAAMELDLGVHPYASHEPFHAWGDAATMHALLAEDKSTRGQLA